MPQNNPRIKNSLMSMIIFLTHKAEEKELKPVITIAKLTDMMQSTGLRLTYQQLSELSKDPQIAPFIKSINKNQIEFNLGGEELQQEPAIPDFNTNEQPQADSNEENPEDFAAPEDENNEESFNQTEENPNNAMEPQEYGPPHQQKSIVSQMARRAAARAD